jgi:hypothetical protein
VSICLVEYTFHEYTHREYAFCKCIDPGRPEHGSLFSDLPIKPCALYVHVLTQEDWNIVIFSDSTSTQLNHDQVLTQEDWNMVLLFE